jgi:methionyl-tRNA formyltransferase
MQIVFFGSSDFGIPSLEALIRAGHSITGIVSTPPSPSGRGQMLHSSAIHRFAEENGLSPVLTPVSLKDPLFIQKLKTIPADLYVVIAYRILPRDVFTIPQRGTVNVHASLLPRFRGPAPIHRAIEAGETTTGVTVFLIDEGVDTGRIVLQSSLEVGPLETTPQLYERLSQLGAASLPLALKKLEEQPVEAFPIQDHRAATPAPKLKKEEGHINWSEPAATIERRVRAFKPFPGIYTFLNNRRLTIESSRVLPDSNAAAPGTVSHCDKASLHVQCGEGVLDILTVKPEGKGSMPISAFLCGTKITQGIQFS